MNIPEGLKDIIDPKIITYSGQKATKSADGNTEAGGDKVTCQNDGCSKNDFLFENSHLF